MTYNIDKSTLLETVFNSKNTTYLTHNYHPYSAKFIPQIPRFFIEKFSNKYERILDPFCGSGTTLVEAKLLKRNSIGFDIHPLGIFMSKVKTTNLGEEELSKALLLINKIESHIDFYYSKNLKKKLITSYFPIDNSLFLDYTIPNFHNRDHWFQEDVQHEIAIIKSLILNNTGNELSDFLLLALSSIIVSISNQESETRYAAISKEYFPKQTFLRFNEKVLDMIRRMKEFNNYKSKAQCNVFLTDSRQIDEFENNSIDLIVTSPPYPNTYDYYLYHKSRMHWLDFSWNNLKNDEIGSRLKHSSRKLGIEIYIDDMTKCFNHFKRILKPDKFFIIVIGDSIIRKEKFKGDSLIEKIAIDTGFKKIDKINYSLDKISKTFQSAFRQKGKEEHIIILRK